MSFGMYSDEEDEQKGLISPVVRDYLMRKRQNGQPQPVDTLNDVSRYTPPMTGLSVDQENMAPLAKSPQDGLAEASDSSGVRDAEQADMIAQGAGSLSKILAQALNAKYAGHTKPMDYSSFDSISQMGKPGLAAAQRQRQEKIDSFKMSDELSQRDKKEALDSSDRSRRTSWEDESRGFERTAQGNSAEDRTRQLSMQSEEDDPSSGVSRSYQTMATKMTGGKSDYSGASATRLKAALPALSKMYEFDQSQQSRRDAMNERRQMHEETLQNRLDAASQQKAAKDQAAAEKSQAQGAMLNVPGYQHDPAVGIKPENAEKMRDAAVRLDAFKGSMQDLVELQKQYGNFETGENGAKMEALSKDLQVQMKELAKLGVLSASDMVLIEKQIPSLGGGMGNLFSRNENTAAQLQQTLNSRVSEAEKTMASRGYSKAGSSSKPKSVIQNGHTYILNEATGEYE